MKVGGGLFFSTDPKCLCPVQGKSPPMQVKEPYVNLDMVTCKLSSRNPECTKNTCRKYSKEGLCTLHPYFQSRPNVHGRESLIKMDLDTEYIVNSIDSATLNHFVCFFPL